MALDHTIGCWNALLREVVFCYRSCLVIQCSSINGEQVITIDHDPETRMKTMTIGKLQIPVDLLMVMKFMTTILTHVEYEIMLMLYQDIQHPALPEAEKDHEKYYYKFQSMSPNA